MEGKTVSIFTMVQGHKMFLDSRDSLNLLVNEYWEPLETDLARKSIKEGGVVIDVGANIGYYTLIFADLVGEGGRVFAFEPDPDNFALLVKNVEANGYQNVVLVQKAISNETGKIRLYLCKDNKGDHRIYDSHDDRESIEVEAVRLDDYFKDYDRRINFVKMDIQGAEGGAVKGASELLRNNAGIKIVTEFCPPMLKMFGTDPGEYLKLLQGLGFELSEVNETTGKIEPIGSLENLQSHICGPKIYTNIYGVKND
jgi:FkbM family methyltransferase